MSHPALSFPTELVLRAQDIALVILDVDGVLTDGRLYYSEAGETLKTFSTLDGHGIKLLAQAKVEVAIITGRKSVMVERRAAELGISALHQAAHDKLAIAEQMLKAKQLNWSQVAVMGDDWPDLPMMVRAGLAAAPSNAHREVRARSHHVSTAQGGKGAVRELCDLILTAKGIYSKEILMLCEHKSLAIT
jgi:3-deoxy-D-manno-octulosonate 8-phosphate phosphatase (KDO 8-P phosphatase)